MRTGENIHKRKDGRWEARVPIGRNCDRKLVYKFLYATTYREAKRKKILYEEQHRLSEEQQEQGIEYVFKDIANAWLEDCKSFWKPSTYNKYANCLQKHIFPKWENRVITDLVQEDYNLLLTEIKEGKSISACTTINLVLRGIMKYLVNTRKITLKFTVGATAVSKTSDKMPEPLSNSEWNRLVAYTMEHPDGTNLGILISLYEGVRIGELCALRWENIDLDRNTLYVSETVQRLQVKDALPGQPRTKLSFGLPKNGTKRSIPIHPNLYPLLKKARDKHKPSDFILSGTEIVVEPRTFSNRFHKGLQNCDVRKIHVHILRHPYVKHTTKNISLQKQKSQTTNRFDSLGFLFLCIALC